MAEPMTGTADPYWQRLSDLIVQGSIGSEQAEELKAVFEEATLGKWHGRVPSYLLSGAVLWTSYLHCDALWAVLHALHLCCMRRNNCVACG